MPIRLAELVPLDPGRLQSRELSVERYRFLLDRAIDRELAFAAAQSQGVGLTTNQSRNLEELRALAAHTNVAAFDDLQVSDWTRQFELRDATAQLLLSQLAQRAGVRSPSATAADVSEYYRQHAGDYGPLSADPQKRQAEWESIDQDIRQKLAPNLRQEYETGLSNFVYHLRWAADVQVKVAGP